MTDADIQHAASAAPVNGGRARPPRYPNALNGWIDDELHQAIASAAAAEKEPQIVIVRRWLRLVARQSGFYQEINHAE